MALSGGVTMQRVIEPVSSLSIFDFSGASADLYRGKMTACARYRRRRGMLADDGI